MDWWPSVGRVLRRLRQRVFGASYERFLFECRHCGQSFYRPRQHCPECGADNIARYEF